MLAGLQINALARLLGGIDVNDIKSEWSLGLKLIY
jgi:hypothetical protein